MVFMVFRIKYALVEQSFSPENRRTNAISLPPVISDKPVQACFFKTARHKKRNGAPEDTTSHQLKSQYFEQ